VTESGSIIPFHKGTKVVELKSAIATDFFTDLSENRHAEQAVGRLFEVADNVAQVSTIETMSKPRGAPEVTFGTPISLGSIKGDNNEQVPIPIVIAGPLKNFNHFATFIIQSSLQLELSIVTKDFTKATGLVSVDVEGPAFVDQDEGVFVRFDERNTYRIKNRCNEPERTVDVPLSEKQNKRLTNLIHMSGPTGEPSKK
jgi:hypothetical protein